MPGVTLKRRIIVCSNSKGFVLKSGPSIFLLLLVTSLAEIVSELLIAIRKWPCLLVGIFK